MRNIFKTLFFIFTLTTMISCGDPQEEKAELNENQKTELATRWSEEKANAWGARQPWLVGANFNPSDASNQLEFWQAETWNPELIDKELGWASEIGMNTMRVYLHYFPYRDDKENFLARMDQFLEISSKHNIKPMFVFFDDVWNPNPVAGTQPEPTPHLHNSNWVQSPGKDILWNPERHIELKPYVQDVMNRYKDDNRVLLWDLYNEPQNTNKTAYGEQNKGKKVFSMILLKNVFEWAREVNPSQPISSAPWTDDWANEENMTEFHKFMFDNSDIITYHNYADINEFKRVSEPLKRYNRPLICTEYMARGNNSTFETHLPYMAENNIGAINWGLVAGRTNTAYPWDSWDREYTAEPELWFHEVFKKDGSPYKQVEVDLIKKLTQEKNEE